LFFWSYFCFLFRALNIALPFFLSLYNMVHAYVPHTSPIIKHILKKKNQKKSKIKKVNMRPVKVHLFALTVVSEDTLQPLLARAPVASLDPSQPRWVSPVALHVLQENMQPKMAPLNAFLVRLGSIRVLPPKQNAVRVFFCICV
jgi:hypothetical protein